MRNHSNPWPGLSYRDQRVTNYSGVSQEDISYGNKGRTYKIQLQIEDSSYCYVITLSISIFNFEENAKENLHKILVCLNLIILSRKPLTNIKYNMNRKYNLDQLNEYVYQSRFTVEKHPYADIYIYGYNLHKIGKKIVWDQTNINLRGMVVDKTGKVLSQSFKKFFTFEKYISDDMILCSDGTTLELPQSSYEIYEKLDGSLAMTYWIGDKVYLSSQRSFVCPSALKATDILYTKYSSLIPLMNPNFTYIFEAIYPQARVIVDYGNLEDIILIGIINHSLNEEISLESHQIGFRTAKNYTEHLEPGINLTKLENLDIANLEGFVLVYENGFRLKIKFPWFSEAHVTLNQILKLEKDIYYQTKKLNMLCGVDLNRISNYTIWKNIDIGHTKKEILNLVPTYFLSYGFEMWLETQMNTYANENHNEDNKGKSEILFTKYEELFFNLEERQANTVYYTPMWNFFNRISKSYF